MAKVHNIFVIHSYRHDGDKQHELIGMLRGRSRFVFHDWSIPDVSKYQGVRLKAEIKKRISKADVVLMIARPAIGKSAHIRFEVEHAAMLGKPIIAIRPHGLRNSAAMAQEHAKAVIDWDVEEIVAQIRRPGRVNRPEKAVVETEDAEDEAVIAHPEDLRSYPSDVASPVEVLGRIHRVEREFDVPQSAPLPLSRHRNLFG